MNKSIVMVALSTVFLSACGGSGGNDSPPPANALRTIEVGVQLDLETGPMAEAPTLSNLSLAASSDLASAQEIVEIESFDYAAEDFLEKANYYIHVLGSGRGGNDVTYGPIRIDDNTKHSVQVADGYVIRIEHEDLMVDMDAPVSPAYSVEGEVQISADTESQITIELTNKHFGFITIDDSEFLVSAKINDEEIFNNETPVADWPKPSGYAFGFVTDNRNEYNIQLMSQLYMLESTKPVIVNEHHQYKLTNFGADFEVLYQWQEPERTLTCSVDYYQGFETNTEGWVGGDGYGFITQADTMINGFPSDKGIKHLLVEGDPDPDDGKYYSAFTRFGGYADSWSGTWITQNRIYLDPSWADGEGFDWSVAVNGTDNAHKRDHVIHVTKDPQTGTLLVAYSTGSNFAPRLDLATLDFHEITEAGWYTFEHMFYADGSLLMTDINLRDEQGNRIWTKTVNHGDTYDGTATAPGKPFAVGNRYGWFTHVTVTGGIAVDETKLLRRCQ